MTSSSSRLRSIRALGLMGLAFLSGCASIGKPAGFLEDYSRLHQGDYFKQEYAAPGADFYRYQKVKVEPIELRYYKDRGEFEAEELERLASSLETELKKGVQDAFEIVESTEGVDEKTLVVKAILVDADAPPRALNVVTSALILVPVANGSATFEAKILDGGTGKTVAEIAEKKEGNLDVSSLTVGPFMKFADAEAVFKSWGKSLGKFLRGK